MFLLLFSLSLFIRCLDVFVISSTVLLYSLDNVHPKSVVVSIRIEPPINSKFCIDEIKFINTRRRATRQRMLRCFCRKSIIYTVIAASGVEKRMISYDPYTCRFYRAI
jgi:hypothetical protein